jgi:hypothetical protein
MAADADYYIFPGGYTPAEIGPVSSKMKQDFNNGMPVEAVLTQAQIDTDRIMAALGAKVILNVESLFKAPTTN